jgi:hypothetical protein
MGKLSHSIWILYIGITDLTSDGILCSLEETLSKYHLSFDNLLSFTSDTCNVMKGAKNGVIAKLLAKQPMYIASVML